MRSPRLSALRERLLRAGVSPRGVRRVIGELEDHFQDVLRELEAQGLDASDARARADERLGSDEVLVASILARPELTSWARRWPVVAFAILPLPAFAAAFIASIAALAGAAYLVHTWPFRPSTGWQLASRCFSFWILWALPTATAILCAYAAWRRRVSLLWPAVGILIVGVLGALTNFGLRWPTPTSRGAIGAGIGFGTAHEIRPLLRAASTIGIALLVYFGGWLSSRRELETAANATLPLTTGE